MLALAVAVAVTVLDQATKHVVARTFDPGESVSLIPGLFSLTYVRNTGAAWGIFSGLNGWLATVSFAALVLLVAFRRRILGDGRPQRITLGLLAAGILGNLLDRVRLAYVIDFLDFHWRTHHFPAFNVADSAICIGVGLYVLSSLRHPHAGREATRQ